MEIVNTHKASSGVPHTGNEEHKQKTETGMPAGLKELSDYKHALDDASIVAITDTKGIIIFVNDNFCKISKYSREELVGNDHRMINSKYHPKSFFADLWSTIKSGKTWKGDIRNRAKDGSHYWVQTVIIPFIDESGKPYQFMAIRNDITALKLSEERNKNLNEKLLSNEQKFYSLIKYSTDIIILLDKDFRTKFQSEATERLTGWTLEEMQKISRFDHVHPDDAPSASAAIYCALDHPRLACDIRYRKLHKKGHYIWLEGTITNYLDDPALNGFITNLRDVTQRIESEELLSKKNREITDILDRIEDGFITLDKNMVYTSANAQIEKITGYKSDYLIGKNVWEVFPDAVGSQTYQAIYKALETKSYIKNTDHFPRLNLWQENHIYPSNDGVAIFIRDISAQMQAEEKLKKANEKLAFHITNTPFGCVEFDENFRITTWSPQAETMFGWHQEEVLGKNMGDINFVYEEDNQIVSEVVEKLLSGVIHRNHMINRNIRKDGEVIFCEWNVSVLRDGDSAISVMCFVQDVTERINSARALRKSEESYRALIEEAVDGIIVYDEKRKQIVSANKRICHMLGIPLHKLVTMKVEELLQGDAQNITAIEDHLKNSNDELKFEKSIIQPSGNLLSAEVSVKRMPGETYMAFIRDITERKKHETEIKELNEGLENMVIERTLQLETANKDLEAFSYSVSHDLRAPLRAINGYANILEEDYDAVLDKEGKRLLREVQENARKMGTLIDDLLTFSRMGRKPINKTMINMNGLTITSWDEVLEVAQTKVELVLHPLENALADYALIKQVMINLLSNAVKYSSKKGDARVEVSSVSNFDNIVYAIKDNGVGFDMKYVNKLFGVFQRLHSTDEFEGTGVGLATVQRIIAKHGGSVWAEAIENEGATFYFSLPIE